MAWLSLKEYDGDGDDDGDGDSLGGCLLDYRSWWLSVRAFLLPSS